MRAAATAAGIVLAIVLALHPPSASAEEAPPPPPPIALSVEVFGRPAGRANGAWLPLRAVLRNDGPAERVRIEAHLGVMGRQGVTVTDPVVYQTEPFDLPPGLRSREIYVYVPAWDELQGLPPAFLVECQRESGESVADAALALRGGATVATVLALGDPLLVPSLDGADFGLYLDRVEVLPVQAIDLPVRAYGYDAVTAVLIGGADLTTLAPAQAEALATWVEGGGHLVCAYAGNPREYDGTFLDPLLPCEVTDAREIELAPLGEALGAEPPRRDRGTLALVTPREGAAVALSLPARAIVREPPPEGTEAPPAGADEPPLPAICWGRRGLGRVTYVALDLRTQAFAGWDGRTKLVRRILPDTRSPLLPTVRGARSPIEEEMLRQVSTALPELEPPTFVGIGALLITYVALASAGLYVLSRGLIGTDRRRVLAALILPAALPVSFAAILYIIAWAGKPIDAYQTTWSVVRMRVGDPACRITTYVGWFAPSKDVVDIEATPGSAATPFAAGEASALLADPAIVRTESPNRLADVQLQQWTVRTFRVDEFASVPAVEGSLQLVGDDLQGTLDLPFETSRAVLILGHIAVPVDLGVGGAIQADLSDACGGDVFPASEPRPPDARQDWRPGWYDIFSSSTNLVIQGAEAEPAFRAAAALGAFDRQAGAGTLGAVLVAVAPPGGASPLAGGPALDATHSGTVYVVDVPVQLGLRRESDGAWVALPPGTIPARLLPPGGVTRLPNGRWAPDALQADVLFAFDIPAPEGMRLASYDVLEPATGASWDAYGSPVGAFQYYCVQHGRLEDPYEPSRGPRSARRWVPPRFFRASGHSFDSFVRPGREVQISVPIWGTGVEVRPPTLRASLVEATEDR